METNVYFCKKNGILLMAYQNGKNQNVFLRVSRADYAPFIETCLICDNSYNIEKVITNCYEYPSCGVGSPDPIPKACKR